MRYLREERKAETTGMQLLAFSFIAYMNPRDKAMKWEVRRNYLAVWTPCTKGKAKSAIISSKLLE